MSNETAQTIFSIDNKKYNLGVYLHKKGQNPIDGCQIPIEMIHLVSVSELIANPFPKVILQYESNFGMSFERVSPDDYYSDQTGQKKVPDYTFEYAGKDFIYIELFEVQEDSGATTDIPPSYPILKCDFIVASRQESVFRNVFDKTNGTLATLSLIPVAEWILSTSFPQWTTGYDKEQDVPSGKKTGLCIKEILELLSLKIDPENFDLSGPTVNMTSLVNDSAYITIMKLFDLHYSETKNGDPCVFRYDPVEDFFILKPLSTFITDDQTKDKIKAYDQIVLNGQSTEIKKEITNIIPRVSELYIGIESINDTLDKNKPRALTARRKSTFVIDGRRYNTDNIEKHFKDNYYKDPIFGDGVDSTKIIVPFNKDGATDPVYIQKTARWRNSERESNASIIYNKFMTSQSMFYNAPAVGEARKVGRKFVVRMYGGAIDEFTKKVLGIYVTTGLITNISPKYNIFTNVIDARKILPSKYEKFSLSSFEQA